jgi:hypothetical protein
MDNLKTCLLQFWIEVPMTATNDQCRDVIESSEGGVADDESMARDETDTWIW